MNFDDPTIYDVQMDPYTAELIKSMDRRFSRGPQPISGDYRLTHGGELGFWTIARYATGYLTGRVLVSYTVKESIKTASPATNAGIAVVNAGTPHEHYTYVSSDEPYYPGKGLVEFVSGIFD